jgi:hypothetical protein
VPPCVRPRHLAVPCGRPSSPKSRARAAPPCAGYRPSPGLRRGLAARPCALLRGNRERPAFGGRLRGPGGTLFSVPDPDGLALRPARGGETAFSVPGIVSTVLAAANGWLLALLGIKGMPARGSGSGQGDAPHAGRLPAACAGCAPRREKGTQGKMPPTKAENRKAPAIAAWRMGTVGADRGPRLPSRSAR